MTQKDELETIYRSHHEKRGRYGYLYCHGERGPFIRKWIGTGKKVLDLGCRDGMLTSFYADGNQVTGADIDREALQRAQEKLRIETLWLDINGEWPFAPKSFDAIVACEIAEHLFFLDKFLDQVWMALAPGGLFIGSVPNAFRMRNRLKFLFGKEYENDPTHVRQFSYDKLERLLSARFQDVEIVPLQGKIFPFLSVSPAMPKGLNRLFARDLLWKASKPVESRSGESELPRHRCPKL